MKQSPLHVQEYLETVYTDQVLTHVDAERLEDVDTLIAQVTPPVVELAEMSAAPERQEPRRRRRAIALATAAVVVLCVLLSPLIFKRYKAEPEYATALGEQRTIQLADSSIVTLNADSRIQLRLDPTRRNIDLLRGEALFKVAHDPRRRRREEPVHLVLQQWVSAIFSSDFATLAFAANWCQGSRKYLPHHSKDQVL